MPIFRYFVFVGGALLALLFAVDLVLPASPVAQAVATAGSDQPLIRIRSDRHLPDRVVLDTTQPTITLPPVAMAAVTPSQPPAPESAASALAEMSAKARVRETFAQFPPKADAATVKRAEVRPQAQQRRRVARARPVPQQWAAPQWGQWGRPMIQVAQQPHSGFFNTTW